MPLPRKKVNTPSSPSSTAVRVSDLLLTRRPSLTEIEILGKYNFPNFQIFSARGAGVMLDLGAKYMPSANANAAIATRRSKRLAARETDRLGREEKLAALSMLSHHAIEAAPREDASKGQWYGDEASMDATQTVGLQQVSFRSHPSIA